MIVRRQTGDQLATQRLVLRDQRPLRRAAPRCSRKCRTPCRAGRAARPARRSLHHPRPEAHLARLAGRRILARRAAAARDGIRSCRSPSNASRDLRGERAVGVEPRDLVLVLVRHQLEEIARHRLGEARLRPGRVRRLGGRRPVDEGAIALGVGGVLVGGQERRRGARRSRPGLVGGRRGGRAAQARLDRRGIGARRRGPSRRRRGSSRPPRRSARSPGGSPPPTAGHSRSW